MGIDEILDEALEEQSVLQHSDFDQGSKRFLTELMNRDRTDGTCRAVEALEAVFKQTRSKDRDSVRKGLRTFTNCLRSSSQILWKSSKSRRWSTTLGSEKSERQVRRPEERTSTVRGSTRRQHQRCHHLRVQTRRLAPPYWIAGANLFTSTTSSEYCSAVGWRL